MNRIEYPLVVCAASLACVVMYAIVIAIETIDKTRAFFRHD